jgi:hypothetical protein
VGDARRTIADYCMGRDVAPRTNVSVMRFSGNLAYFGGNCAAGPGRLNVSSLNASWVPGVTNNVQVDVVSAPVPPLACRAGCLYVQLTARLGGSWTRMVK